MEKLLTVKQVCAKLECCEKTLRAAVRAGEIRYVLVGRGLIRKQKRFSTADVAAYIESRTQVEIPIERGSKCQSTSRKTAASTATRSQSEVIGFSDLLARRQNAQLVRSSGRSA